MNTADQVNVMIAFMNGHRIESRHKCGIEWYPCPRPAWDWVRTQYRVVAPTKHHVVLDLGEFTQTEWDWFVKDYTHPRGAESKAAIKKLLVEVQLA